jgi:hypothetical protein
MLDCAATLAAFVMSSEVETSLEIDSASTATERVRDSSTAPGMTGTRPERLPYNR